MFEWLWVLILSFFQNVSFSVTSRSRNRNNMTYHLFAATCSNTIWFVTFRQLVTANMSFVLFVPYTLGTVVGSLSGVKVSMWIETWLRATSDSHIKKPSRVAAIPSAATSVKDRRPEEKSLTSFEEQTAIVRMLAPKIRPRPVYRRKRRVYEGQRSLYFG